MGEGAKRKWEGATLCADQAMGEGAKRKLEGATLYADRTMGEGAKRGKVRAAPCPACLRI
jgi:hypothetical protein